MKALSGIIAVLALVFPAIAYAEAPLWSVDKDHSKIGFSAQYESDQLSGAVSGYDTQIRFSPDDLQGSSARIEFDMSSVLTGEDIYDSSLPGEEWLNVAKFPKASFLSTSFDGLDPETGLYTLHGTLTLMGISKDISIPFRFAPRSDGKAVVDGSFQIKRSDFGVGDQSSDSKNLSEFIDVSLHLTASPQP